MRLKINKNYIVYILLMGIVGIHLLGNIFFLVGHILPEGKDSYAHITAFLNFSGIFENGQANPFYQNQMTF